MEKKPLTGLFLDQPETPEGKYLVKRRDGTVPGWPHFVLGARDPIAEVALLAYADEAERRMRGGDGTITAGFVAALRRHAALFRAYRLGHGEGDPGMGAHREDDPATVAEMRNGWSA